MLRSAEQGGRERVWNEIEALLIEVEEGIEERPSWRGRADRTGNMER